MKRIIIFLLTLTILTSCSNDIDQAISTNNSDGTLPKKTKNLEVATQMLKPIYRYYCWWRPYHSNHLYSVSKPSSLTWGTPFTYKGDNYKYEGIAFYTFATPSDSFNGEYPDAVLYCRYEDYRQNNTLFILKPGQADPRPEYEKVILGYVFSTYKKGLVAIREYHSQEENDSFYFASDEIYEQFGPISDSYVYKGIVGYTIPSAMNFGKKHPTYVIISNDPQRNLPLEYVPNYFNDPRFQLILTAKYDPSDYYYVWFGTEDSFLSNQPKTLVLPIGMEVHHAGMSYYINERYYDPFPRPEADFQMFSIGVGEEYESPAVHYYTYSRYPGDRYSIFYLASYKVKKIDKNIIFVENNFFSNQLR